MSSRSAVIRHVDTHARLPRHWPRVVVRVAEMTSCSENCRRRRSNVRGLRPIAHLNKAIRWSPGPIG